MKSEAGFSDLLHELWLTYDADATSSPVVIIWAATNIIPKVGLDEAKAQLRAINAHRQRFGMIPAYADYGSPLF